ncbi:MAG: L-fucose/L-arabinose isomerase family protein [Flexilinea sp.]
MKKITLAVLFGSREFFPASLVFEARKQIFAVLDELGINYIALGEEACVHGAVTTYAHARECAELFKKHADKIDGILISLPNFGDEKGIVDTIKLSGLRKPILVQAFPDDLEKFDQANRRDSFCGKISVCNNLRQYGYSFSVTTDHCVYPAEESFIIDLKKFTGVCRVVNKMHNARLGAIGARPNAFNTVRYSEKLLENIGISVMTADLSEIIGPASRLTDDDKSVKNELEKINVYIPHEGIPDASILRMAKFKTVLDRWIANYEIDATAIQCWNSIQENFGINVCTLMSMMSEEMMPSACETDITGLVSMYALQLAGNAPSILVDWNNNYAGEKNKCVLFHCGNFAKSYMPGCCMGNAKILATTMGTENTMGTIDGRVPGGKLTFARVSTDDVNGVIRAYTGEGKFVDDKLETFGARAVVEIPDLQGLIRFICLNGFEHHVAVAKENLSDIITEAFEGYLGWETYLHV